MGRFSIQTIIALTEVITGGSAASRVEPVGVYRSGPQLEHFFGGANLELHIGSGSRFPTVRELLTNTNNCEDGEECIKRVIEQVVDPREYLDQPKRLGAVVNYLNRRLRLDGFEIRFVGDRHRLCSLETNAQVVSALRERAVALDFDSVRADFDRALDHADQDPEDAITAACSIVESVCKCLLDEMGQPYPARQDISGLVREVLRHLGLSPEREDIIPDMKQIVGGLSNTTSGIGALRTHAGDAHGHGRALVAVDGRIARLAIHSASTVCLFFIETWQKRIPR